MRNWGHGLADPNPRICSASFGEADRPSSETRLPCERAPR